MIEMTYELLGGGLKKMMMGKKLYEVGMDAP